MAECECVPKCPFFHDRMAAMPAMAGMLKKKYCLGDKQICARYQVRSGAGPNHIPDDLYPTQNERAAQIVAAAKRA